MMSQKVQVQGIAVRPGISKNGILYNEEELRNFTPTLINKPILKDHRGEVDNTVGLVEATGESMGVVTYSGWVKEDGTNLIEKINDGRIKEVSIGAFVKQLVKENDDDEHMTAVGLEGMELSLTPTPAVTGTSVTQTLKTMEAHKIDKKIKVLPICESVNDFTEEARGDGQGQGGPKQGDGGATKCKCSSCGNIVKHEKGVPCSKTKCPKCGGQMVGESINKDKEEINMAEDIKPEDKPAEPVAPAADEVKEEPKVEDKPVEEPVKEPEAEPAKESKSVDVDVKLNTESMDKVLEKQKQIIENASKIAELQKVEVKEEVKPASKGKVAEETTAPAEVESERYKCEESSRGYSLWKMPEANGSLIAPKEE